MKNFKKTHPLFFTKTIGIEPLFEVRGGHLGPKYKFYEILTIFFHQHYAHWASLGEVTLLRLKSGFQQSYLFEVTLLIPKVVSWLVTSGILRTPVRYQQSYLENVFRGNFADTESGVLESCLGNT